MNEVATVRREMWEHYITHIHRENVPINPVLLFRWYLLLTKVIDPVLYEELKGKNDD
jgi:hypothetical protein